MKLATQALEEEHMSVKYGMVLDLDRCIGCYACIVACKMTYGTRQGVNYNGVKPVEWGQYPDAHQRFVLTMCMHCDDPACRSVCPTGATYKAENGMVLVDYDKCIGCGYCISACPYGQRYLIRDQEINWPGHVQPYEEESAKRRYVAEKCVFCSGRVAAGAAPACTVHCPGQCRIFGDVNDPESVISKYIKDNNARQVPGTSLYYVLPAGMAPEFLPAAYEVPAFVTAKSAGATVGKVALGASVAAVLGSLIASRRGGKENE
jgi:molybdopterin-containing oxidoreductase family iron-sulfur binding subunit